MIAHTYIDDGTLTEAIILTPADDPAAQAAFRTYLAYTDDHHAAVQTPRNRCGDRR